MSATLIKSSNPEAAATERFAFSEREAAAALGISVRTLFTLRKSGQIRFAKIGSRVVITPDAIREFLRVGERATALNGPATDLSLGCGQ